MTIADGLTPTPINLMVIYPALEMTSNLPQNVRLNLLHEGEIVYSTIAKFTGEGASYDTNADGVLDYATSSPPLYIPVPDISATLLQIELWSFATPQPHTSAPILSEVEVYSWGSNQLSTLYASNETEVIARTVEFDSNQSPGYFFDNGDDVFCNGEYYSRPRQNGMLNILVGVSHQNPGNPCQRYNFNINSALSVGTSLPAYVDFNRPAGSILDQILSVLSFIVLMVLIILVNVVASLIPGLNLIVAWIDVAVIGVMTAELLFFGELGYLGYSEAYQSNKYFRLVYDWVFDWDCSIARFILPGQSYDTVNYRWKPD